MNWHHHIDIYCERTNEMFWAEPINALSNMAFIIAAFLLFRQYKQHQLHSWPVLFLIFLLCFIGMGSFLFHTFANRWSELADTIPIWSFVVFYILFSVRMVFESSWLQTARIMVFVFIFAYLGFVLSHTDGSADEMVLNGSLQYAPALLLLVVYTMALYIKKKSLSHYAMYAVGIFVVSLIFRTIDMQYCSSIVVGTHFIWHVLNAIMLYYLIYILVLYVRKKSRHSALHTSV